MSGVLLDEPDSRRSETIGFLSVRCSGPAVEGWETRMTGTSLLGEELEGYDMSETSCWPGSRAPRTAATASLEVVDDYQARSCAV